MANRVNRFPIFNFQFSIFNLQSLICFLLCLFFAAAASADVQLPELNAAAPIRVTAQAGNRWQAGSYEVWVLRGDCAIQQGDGLARCQEAVLWIPRDENAEPGAKKIIAYLEGNVELSLDRRPGAPRLNDKAWLGRFETSAGVDVAATNAAGKPDVLPAIYWRGIERRSSELSGLMAASQNGPVRQAQYSASAPNAAGGQVAPAPSPAPQSPSTFPENRPTAPAPVVVPMPARRGPATAVVGERRIRVFPRSDAPVQAQWFPDPSSNRWVAVIDSGVNVIVDGMSDAGTIDVSTDRLVIWTTGVQEPDLTGRTPQDQRVPLELYMEGNIVFRQGERIIYADRMYYDVPNHVGTVLNADVLTPVRSYEGLLRLHANVVQQTAQDRFFAKEGYLTSSRIGDPSYRLQSNDLYFQDIQHPVIDPLTGQPALDPATGQPVVEHQKLATASNDFLFVGPVPVFYWPTLAADLNDPTYYIRRARLKQDNVFGEQILTNWSGYQLLGIRNKPVGTDFDVSLDYLSQRGLGYGATFTYDRQGLFGVPGRTAGLADFWGIQDQGNDNLGQYRYDVPPEASYRYRLFWQHREALPYDLQLSAELGWISDRNFLEEYYKTEYETLKDESTGIELKRITENRSWSITADYRVNDFVTSTNWLPRLDHFWLGQSLFNDSLTWYEHSSAGYAQFRRTSVPENVTPFLGPAGAAGPFNYLSWESSDREGERFASRQELDWPFQLGVVKVTPYALGEAAHWGEDINGQPMDRLFYQLGLRADMPMWSVDPTACNELLNVHGIAHKVNFEFEFAYAESNQNLEDLPLYDPLDDDSVEAFRRRYLTTTFGIPSMSPMPLPPGTPWIAKFDERLYAMRTGLQSWVTSPSTEIVGDLTTLRFGVDQRWQTKRGPADNRHIIDWITLDTNMTVFPDPNRDDFGSTTGLWDYDFRWHVGDRLTLVSDGIFDCFDQGQKIVSVGGFLTRPPRGSLYAGFRIIQGPTSLDSEVLTVSYTYWMSPKWLSTLGVSYDFGSQGYLGQNLAITRVGESFLVSVGFSFDASRDVTGIGLAIEPRFLSKNRLSNVGGAQIPPAGTLGLE